MLAILVSADPYAKIKESLDGKNFAGCLRSTRQVPRRILRIMRISDTQRIDSGRLSKFVVTITLSICLLGATDNFAQIAATVPVRRRI
ncbi:hypothetical protein BC936DRAFT_146872 [Jimgerdemannia flammicorona]|uniref:Uncharacterized protein n=1 Tax=Jimgerdemannia flammicorona TaxID=994334 RepID=A0A433DL72_9FUNG|nr:hypothetical protein BC936DRAFT_146872 [Jimgerdemannia flammicorona]